MPSNASAKNTTPKRRDQPCNCHAHNSPESKTSMPNKVAILPTPRCCPNTHANQTTVMSMGKAIHSRKTSIHCPGLGS